MNLGAFAVVTLLSRKGDGLVGVENYRGLAVHRPGLAALLSVFLLSLAGMPATAGFAGNFFIFRAAIESGLVGLTVIGVLTTVVSFYYYLYVTVQIYMHTSEEDYRTLTLSGPTAVTLAVSVAMTFYLGLFPSRVLGWASDSALSAFSLLR